MTAEAASGLVASIAVGSIVLVGVLSVLCAYRVVRGPSVPDRVVGIDAIATNVIAIAVLFAILVDRGLFVMVSLVLAIIAFVATVTVAKFVVEGEIIE